MNEPFATVEELIDIGPFKSLRELRERLLAEGNNKDRIAVEFAIEFLLAATASLPLAVWQEIMRGTGFGKWALEKHSAWMTENGD